LIEPGQPAHDEVLREFGNGLEGADGRIDRGKLAEIVFADPAKLVRLNKIIHPRVELAVFRQFEDWQRQGVRDAGFVVAALLVEARYGEKLDGMVVVFCQPEQQLERLLARGMSEADAKRRIAVQMPVEDKLRHATEKIDCSGTMDETREQVRVLAAKLRTASRKL
jgi:dephospho-CoA kinase